MVGLLVTGVYDWFGLQRVLLAWLVALWLFALCWVVMIVFVGCGRLCLVACLVFWFVYSVGLACLGWCLLVCLGCFIMIAGFDLGFVMG